MRKWIGDCAKTFIFGALPDAIFLRAFRKLRVETMAGIETILTLIGGPTVLIEVGGLRLLTDPTFDEPQLYIGGAVPLEKRTGPALAADEIGKVDAVLLSHEQHLDNLDYSGRAFLARAGTTFTTPASAKKLGEGARGLLPFETATLTSEAGRAFITAAPARHGPVGFEPISGDVAGFLIGLERAGDAIYVTGDTVWYEGVAEVAERFSPKLVIAFAGSAKPRGPFHVTMDNNDLIATANAFPKARIIAVHNDGWAHFTESQADAFKAFGALSLTNRLVPLDPGRPATLML